MKTQLAIELSENAVQFTSLQDGIAVQVDFFSFKDRLDYRFKEQLEQIFQEKKYKEIPFDEYTVSWYTPNSTLLPNNVFTETKPEDSFRLCFNKDVPNSHIDYNRISELSIVNVFDIPLWVKSFFVIKFPRIVIQNEGSLLLRYLFSSSTLAFQSVITIHQDSVCILIVKENSLQFYSHFNYINSDDIVYHLMFILQQLKAVGEKGVINLVKGVGSLDEIVEEVKVKLLKLKDLDTLEIKINSHILIKSHLLCV